MRFTLISEMKICEPEHLLEPPVWRLSRCVATQEPCLTRLKMPVSSLGGAADSGQGLVGVHKSPGSEAICSPRSQATAASRLRVPLPRQRLDFRAAHRISRTYTSYLCRSHFEQIGPRSSTSAPAATPADSPGRRRPAIPAQHPSNGDRATVDENDDGNHDHHTRQARWSSLLAPP